jgi:hypothetical protein
MEDFPGIQLHEMAIAIQNQITAVRTLEGMRSARAIIVVESNAMQIAASLKRKVDKMDMTDIFFLHLDPVANDDRKGFSNLGISRDTGELLPGLNTTPVMKSVLMEKIDEKLNEHKIHLHRHMITYATKNTAFEEQVGDAIDFSEPDVRRRLNLSMRPGMAETNADLQRIFVQEKSGQVRGELTSQFKRMLCVELRKVHPVTGNEKITYIYSGKNGYDPNTRMPFKDDMIMAITIGLHGAFYFYTKSQFISERAVVGL